MATDLEIKTDTQKFKYRVSGIIINDNKLLTLKMKNKDTYCLPGGHAELGEDTRTAVIREMLEEIETEVKIVGELAIIESFYTDRNNLFTHDLGFYYIVEPTNWDNISQENYTRTENDKGEMKVHNFEWIELSKLKDVDLLPACLKDKLSRGDFSLEHLIVKD